MTVLECLLDYLKHHGQITSLYHWSCLTGYGYGYLYTLVRREESRGRLNVQRAADGTGRPLVITLKESTYA